MSGGQRCGSSWFAKSHELITSLRCWSWSVRGTMLRGSLRTCRGKNNLLFPLRKRWIETMLRGSLRTNCVIYTGVNWPIYARLRIPWPNLTCFRNENEYDQRFGKVQVLNHRRRSVWHTSCTHTPVCVCEWNCIHSMFGSRNRPHVVHVYGFHSNSKLRTQRMPCQDLCVGPRCMPATPQVKNSFHLNLSCLLIQRFVS
jgi:hypothetical protein